MIRWLKQTKAFLSMNSFRVRLVTMLGLLVLVPTLVLALVSYFSLFAGLNERLHAGITTNLASVRAILDDAMETLNRVSQQVIYADVTVGNLRRYFDRSGLYDRSTMAGRLKSELILTEFSNRNVSNITYFYRDDEGQLRKIVNTLVAPSRLPQDRAVAQTPGVTYYGPHVTASSVSDYLVLSAVRRYAIPDSPVVDVYLETGYQELGPVLDTSRYGMDGFYVVARQDGSVVYSQADEGITIPEDVHIGLARWTDSAGGRYRVFGESSEYGWRIFLFLPNNQFRRLFAGWLVPFVAVVLVALISSGFIAVRIWRAVNEPIARLNAELHGERQEALAGETEAEGEIDEYVRKFRRMKRRITELMTAVRVEANARAKIEIREMVGKIGPHFVHNTLDTIRWHAEMSGAPATAKLVSSLNRLLHYNLQRNDESSLRQELDSIEQYMTLQASRYDITYEKAIELPPDLLDSRMPRFILQPIVENAIIHGIQGEGSIRVEARLVASSVVIRVIDDGAGIAPERAEEVLSAESGATSEGIGLRFVASRLESMFGPAAGLDISGLPTGCMTEITFPARPGSSE